MQNNRVEKADLFRGFYHDDTGTVKIKVGDDVFVGEWAYWDVFGHLARSILSDDLCHRYYTASEVLILPRTVGQCVGVDKNRHPLFVGDVIWVDGYNESKEICSVEDFYRKFKNEEVEFYRNGWEVQE